MVQSDSSAATVTPPRARRRDGLHRGPRNPLCSPNVQHYCKFLMSWRKALRVVADIVPRQSSGNTAITSASPNPYVRVHGMLRGLNSWRRGLWFPGCSCCSVTECAGRAPPPMCFCCKQTRPPTVLRDSMMQLVMGGAGVIMLVLALATGSTDYQESQGVLRTTQTLRRLRQRAIAVWDTFPVEHRSLIGKGGSSIECRIHDVDAGGPAGGTQSGGRTVVATQPAAKAPPTVVLIAEDGTCMLTFHYGKASSRGARAGRVPGSHSVV